MSAFLPVEWMTMSPDSQIELVSIDWGIYLNSGWVDGCVDGAPSHEHFLQFLNCNFAKNNPQSSFSCSYQSGWRTAFALRLFKMTQRRGKHSQRTLMDKAPQTKLEAIRKLHSLRCVVLCNACSTVIWGCWSLKCHSEPAPYRVWFAPSPTVMKDALWIVFKKIKQHFLMNFALRNWSWMQMKLNSSIKRCAVLVNVSKAFFFVLSLQRSCSILWGSVVGIGTPNKLCWESPFYWISSKNSFWKYNVWFVSKWQII